MACLVYHTKSCSYGMLTLVLVHGRRSSSLTIVQLTIVASLGRPVSSASFSRFVLGAIGSCNCSPSRKSSLGLLSGKEVQWTCFVA
eukprot:312213-Ditylum_brightwellii.AAC.1